MNLIEELYEKRLTTITPEEVRLGLPTLERIIAALEATTSINRLERLELQNGSVSLACTGCGAGLMGSTKIMARYNWDDLNHESCPWVQIDAALRGDKKEDD